MKERGRGRVALASALAVALLLLNLEYRSGGDTAARLRGELGSVVAAMVGVAERVASPVVGAVSRVAQAFSAARENARLRGELRELEGKVLGVQDLERENQRLRQLLEMRGRVQVRTIGARVLGLLPSGFEWVALADAGSRDGVQTEAAVIGPEGLVGKVISVGPSSSRVRLVIDPESTVSVRDARSGELGLARGMGKEGLTVEFVSGKADVLPGDLLVTTGYEGSPFPGGIPVATVESVGRGSSLGRTARARPVAELSRLDVVVVVLGGPR